MPPRKSSRTAASAESSMPPKNPVKRKRGQPVDSDEEEEQDVKPTRRKPSSSSARSSVGPSAGTRTSTRSRTVSGLQEIPESDGGEEEEYAPASKRARQDEKDSEEEPQPTKKASAKRAAPRSRVASGSSGKGMGKAKHEAVEDDKDEEDEEDAPSPPPLSKSRGKRANSASVASQPASVATSRSRRTSVKEPPKVVDMSSDEEEAAEDDEEDVKPIKKTRAAAKPKAAASRARKGPAKRGKAVAVSDASETEPERAPSVKAPSAAVEADEDAEAATAAATARTPSAALSHEEEEEYYEEKSLLDPVVPDLPKAPKIVKPEVPKSRLIIHKLVLINFKSYAGRQEIGPFHKSFSSIVGPNGSGKSNTIDAMLFVFGFKANKMRQKKMSELIHNSARYPDLDFCTVEVHFREIFDLPGPDAFKIVPGSTLIVSRTATKRDITSFKINSRTSSLKEVEQLLLSRGIDLTHKRFLILQGEVESIAQMKPKTTTGNDEGLLEYLEDIIGTSQYKEPIDDALAKMEEYAEDRGDKLNRLRLVEKEKRKLEKDKKDAENWIRLSNEHVRSQSRLFQWYIWRLLDTEKKLNNAMAKIEAELEEEREKNKDDVEHLANSKEHYEGKEKSYAEVKKFAVAAAKDLAVHEKKEVGLNERRKHAAAKAKKLNKSVHEDQAAQTELERVVADSIRKIAKETDKIVGFESSLKDEEKVLETIRDSLKDKTEVFQVQIDEKQLELQPWEAKINVKKSAINVAQSERNDLATKAEALKAQLVDAQERFDNTAEEQATKAAEAEDLQHQKDDLSAKKESADRKLKTISAQVEDLRRKASSSRQKVDEARASQANNKSEGRVIETLDKFYASGGVKGYHGRLGALGTIPEKYDVAISTACGTLTNLLVDTVTQGQACIEHLRKTNAGRANIMVLEKLSNQGMARIQTPQNVPRLFDLITLKDPRFAPAFYKATRDTLVADDLEQANKIAFGTGKRWRVVTLGGQLIDASGTMSGGGNHVSRGLMSAKLQSDRVRPEVIKRYEQDNEAARKELEEKVEELREIEVEVERLGRQGPTIKTALEKVTLDIRGAAQRHADAERRLRELKSQSKPDAKDVARIAALDKTVASTTAELEELQESSDQIKADINALEKKILDIGGSRLMTQKAKVESIIMYMQLSNTELTKAEVTKAKSESDLVKKTTAIAANSQALEEVERELEALDTEFGEVTEIVEDFRQKVAEAQSAAESSKETLDQLKEQYEELKENIQGFLKKELALTQQIETNKKEIAENSKKIDHWNEAHDELESQLEVIEDDSDDSENEEEAPEPAAAPPPAQEDEEMADGEAEDHTPVKPEPGSNKKQNVNKYLDELDTLPLYSPDQLAGLRERDMKADVELLDEKLSGNKPDMSVLEEFKKRQAEYQKRSAELDDVTALRDAEKARYDGLRKQRLEEFMDGFGTISTKLKEMYQMITLGGNAELELVDSMDPFSEGIIFSVMPPKKSWKNISNLSGGEKTLSSLALVFALHVFKPTPLYFMDEIDAALDFRNVSIVANYIKDRTKNAQFIIISLRNDMFELSHRLIGIYKTANATQSISIDNHSLSDIPRPVPTAAQRDEDEVVA